MLPRRVLPSQRASALCQHHKYFAACYPVAAGRGRVAASASAAVAVPMEQVQKPLCDRRSYQHAVLDNGLRVLAIQDKETVFAAACANVQAGYFDDELPGAAHFLEHMVHLGSSTFPDEREYKAFLAAHGGSSNASTSMVHTRYHFKVHASALGGALARLGAALSCPLLAEESAAREVDNVHAEYSRNTNSDSRKLLQLKRSLCEPPYSGFSTGSIKTLWEDPTAAGVSVLDVLRQLWGANYAAESTTVAVVGPQEPQELLQLVQEAFGQMRRSSGSNGSGSNGGCGSNGVSALQQTEAAADAAGMEVGALPEELTSSSSSSSDSSSSAGEDSDVEASAAGGAVDIAAPEAAVHTKARLELLDRVASGTEPCSQIAAPEHGQQPQQQLHHQQQQHQQQTAEATQHHQQRQRQQQQLRHRYPIDVCAAGSVGQFVRVCPQRDLREVQVMWYIPTGAMTHSSVKPWHLASHLLGHEVPGSVAHLLKAQGLVQSLSIGMGDEVRLGRGWMFWGATLQLTQEGEEAVEHVLATLLRGVQVLQRCSDAELQQHWQECAALAATKFDWKDQTEPLAAAQAAAYALHYYPPQQVLSGPALMTSYDINPIRWFLQQLTPTSMNVFWSSRRHNGSTDKVEPFYGAHYSAQPLLPQAWLDTIEAYAAVGAATAGAAQQQEHQHAVAGQEQQQQQVQEQQQQQHAAVHQFAPLPGQLYLPPPNWAIPTDFDLRQQDNTQAAAAVVEPTAGSVSAASSAPDGVVQQPGLCVWHKLDTSYGLPKVHLKLHIVTPAVYATPSATVSARLLVRVLDDLLLPVAYPAELAGTTYSLSTGQGGLLLKVTGFQGVAQQLMVQVLTALKGLSADQVSQRFSSMQGRLTQGLTNWASNNPAQHSEYAAHHLLQEHHHHNRDLLTAAAAAQPQHILQLQQQLVSMSDMHLDMLAYGNISSREATDIAVMVHGLLHAHGLIDPDSWPALGRVYSLCPGKLEPNGTAEGAAAPGEPTDTHSQGAKLAAAAAAAAATTADAEEGSGPVCVTYLPDNPNPSNSNHAVYYWVQLGADDVPSSVMSDLFVQMASKPAFHELRTRQRLGYSVHLSSSSLHRQLGLVVRVQSPSTRPDAVSAAVRAWMAGFRGELEQLLTDKLDSYKQSLLDKYLEPAKSLHEAAHRAWLPIGSSRTLVFDRRQQKAAAVQAIAQQQVMDWYDMYVQPEGQMHHALCVQLWGGVGTAPADALAAALQGAGSRAVAAGNVGSFKQRQLVLPLPAMQMPPARAAA